MYMYHSSCLGGTTWCDILSISALLQNVVHLMTYTLTLVHAVVGVTTTATFNDHWFVSKHCFTFICGIKRSYLAMCGTLRNKVITTIVCKSWIITSIIRYVVMGN